MTLAVLPLAAPWLVLVLAVVAAVLVLRATPRFGRRSRPVAAVALLTALAAYANAYFGYLPQVGDVAGPAPFVRVASSATSATATATASTSTSPAAAVPTSAGRDGAVTTLDVPAVTGSPASGRALVWLPPQYFTEPARRFPVLYLLHGSPGVPQDWFRGGEAARAGLAAARLGEPVVLVAPRMSRGWLDDSECVDRPGFPAETHLVAQVVPAVDAALRTLPGPRERGVAGNSAGGYCALDLGLRHPAVFGSVLALSPLTVPTYSYGSLADLFGHPPDLAAVVAAHEPLALLRHDPQARRVCVRVDVGAQDPLRRPAARFVRDAQRLGVRAALQVRPGGHTFRVWRPALREGVQWFAGTTSTPCPHVQQQEDDRP